MSPRTLRTDLCGVSLIAVFTSLMASSVLAVRGRPGWLCRLSSTDLDSSNRLTSRCTAFVLSLPSSGNILFSVFTTFLSDLV